MRRHQAHRLRPRGGGDVSDDGSRMEGHARGRCSTMSMTMSTRVEQQLPAPAQPGPVADGADLNQPTDPLFGSRRARRRLGVDRGGRDRRHRVRRRMVAVAARAVEPPRVPVPPTPRSPSTTATPRSARARSSGCRSSSSRTIAFLWFVGVIRGRLGDREPRSVRHRVLRGEHPARRPRVRRHGTARGPAVLLAVSDRTPDPTPSRSRVPVQWWCCRCSHPASPRS